MIFSQRREYSSFNIYQHTPGASLQNLSYVLCLSCSPGGEAEGWSPQLWGDTESEAPRRMGHSGWSELEHGRGSCGVQTHGGGGATDAPKGAHFGLGIGPIWFCYIYCKGPESAITECSYPSVKDHRPEGNSHDKDAGAVCSGKPCDLGGIPNRKSLSLIHRVAMRIWITDFRTYLDGGLYI